MAREASSHSFLKGLSAEQLDSLARIASKQQFRPGEAILRQRETADRFYLIEDGRISLEYELPRQRRVRIQEMGPGEALGWSWLTKPDKWQFSATAIDRVKVSIFPVTDLRRLFVRDPALGYAIMERTARALLERLQATRHKLRVYVRKASGDENTQQVC
jgi:CRP/FNR family transcriptional regulator, cyclic AMP receptor protein